MLNRLILSLGLLGVCASSAFAVNFGTTAVVDGVSYTINGAAGSNGVSVQKIGESISFALPIGVSVNTSKQITLEYFVAATTPGNALFSVNQVAGNGSASGASSVTIRTSFDGVVDETAPTLSYGAGSSFAPMAYTFASKPVQWDKVTTVIDLNGLQGFAKVSTYSANYTECPVPEPVTTAALAMGLVGLVSRRRKK